jgi:hypothetical protein
MLIHSTGDEAPAARSEPVNIIPKSNAWVKRKRSLYTPAKARKAMPDKTKEEVKAGTDIEPIVVLDLIMPNGKRMRDCTGAEMKRFGEFLLKQAEQSKKT